MRVVSLLPSATELLCQIGGSDLLVGRSHECDWPARVRELPSLTAQRTPTHAESSQLIDSFVRTSLATGESLYTVDGDLLRSLEPDLIVTQDLCEVCSIDLASVREIASRMKVPPRIVSLNPRSWWDVLDDCLRLGDAIGRPRAAEEAMVALRERWWTAVDFVNPYSGGEEVLFLEWMDPPFVGGHWTPQLISTAGGRHSLNEAGNASRVVKPEEILEAAPTRVVVAPCGYSISETRRLLDEVTRQSWWPLLPAVVEGPGRVALVDGSHMFNRPGPRLVDALEWLVGWLNDRPQLIPEGFPVEYL
jgi:ABC-type Fe3+-hydroxamate transport system substrate-binding protein